jgi:hypothetical protein
MLRGRNCNIMAILADIDFGTLVGLVIVILGLLSQLFGRKKPGLPDVEEPPSGPKHSGTGPAGRPQGRARIPGEWQKEIEALLRGETPGTPPMPPPIPTAPPVMTQRPPPIPYVPPHMGAPGEEPGFVPLPVPPQVRVEAGFDIESRPPPSESLATLAHRVAAKPRAARKTPAEVSAFLASLGSPRSARQAVLASVVLGTPVGLAGADRNQQ